MGSESLPDTPRRFGVAYTAGRKSVITDDKPVVTMRDIDAASFPNVQGITAVIEAT